MTTKNLVHFSDTFTGKHTLNKNSKNKQLDTYVKKFEIEFQSQKNIDLFIRIKKSIKSISYDQSSIFLNVTINGQIFIF